MRIDETVGRTGLADKQLIPLTPAMVQVPVPVGVRPVVGPETVAVKVNVVPRETLVALVVTTTLGINFEIKTLAILLGLPAE